MTSSKPHSVPSHVRAALNMLQRYDVLSADHPAVVVDDYLTGLVEQYEDAQRKLSCGYDTGTGTNCGECLDCLKVNWHFAREAVGNLKEQLDAVQKAYRYAAENLAAMRAYRAGMGASEWRAFLTEEEAALLGIDSNPAKRPSDG